MRLLVRAAAVTAGAALTVSGLGPAVAVDPAVPLSKAGPASAWGWAAGGAGDAVSSVLAIPASLQHRAVRAISVQQHLGVVATADGRVTAWGDGNAASDGAVPAPAGLRNVVDVRAIDGNNGVSAVALTADGRVTAWGASGGGVTAIPASLPQGHVTAIDTGDDYVMALTDDGHIYQWGNSSQISSGLKIPADIQGQVAGISVSKDAGITPGGKELSPNLALLQNGHVVPWGTPYQSNSAWTVPDGIQGDVQKVVTGPAPAAILKDGSVRFWGPVTAGTDPNPQGCDTTPVVPGDTVPAYVACGLPTGLASEKVTDLRLGTAGGGTYAMALTDTGDAYLWGGSMTAESSPNDVAMQVNRTGPVRTGVSAIASNGGGELIAAVVTSGLAIGSDPVVTGTAQVGKTLAGTAGTFSGTPDSIGSQWLANGVAIPGATRPTLTLTSAFVGKRISYRTTAVSGSDTLTATSAQTAAVATPPAPPKPPATHGPTAAQKQQLAKDQAKLRHDQAKLKKLKKSLKKAHGAKKAKLKKKIAKLKKTIKADQKRVAADKSKM